MAGAHLFQAVQKPELDTLGLVAIRDFLKKRARFLRLVAQNNKTASTSRRSQWWLRLTRSCLKTSSTWKRSMRIQWMTVLA
jgi:hypothetical protein